VQDGHNPSAGQPERLAGANRDATREERERLERALGEGWEVTQLLGSGGFANVYAARDGRLKREVAIKTLRTDLGISDIALARFRREAEAVARLRHPSIVPLYYIGGAADTTYFVMPLIRGVTLRDVLRGRAPLPVDQCRSVLADVGGALAAAHREGIVHRDIKPENNILERPRDRAVLVDFGIAKLITAASTLTESGEIVGTPTYMSPEQATADREVGPLSDQYSLAAVGYEMLTGGPPFRGRTAAAIVVEQLSHPPRSVRSIRPEVPAAVSAAIDRALSAEPARRFATMEHFVLAVGGPASLPAAAERTGSRERVVGWQIVVESPGSPIRRVELTPDREVVIGRGSDADVQLPGDGQAVSRRHCRLALRGGALFVDDLASKNGTYVNGRRVQSASLASGDCVTCGSSVLRVLGTRHLDDTLTDQGPPIAP
jgi:serine/threonine protein kinase